MLDIIYIIDNKCNNIFEIILIIWILEFLDIFRNW